MPFVGAYTRPINTAPINPRFFTYAPKKPMVVKKPIVAFVPN